MSSSQRYGSATVTPWWVSTTSPLRAAGYANAARAGGAGGVEGATAGDEDSAMGGLGGVAGAAQPATKIANGIRMGRRYSLPGVVGRSRGAEVGTVASGSSAA